MYQQENHTIHSILSIQVLREAHEIAVATKIFHQLEFIRMDLALANTLDHRLLAVQKLI